VEFVDAFVSRMDELSLNMEVLLIMQLYQLEMPEILVDLLLIGDLALRPSLGQERLIELLRGHILSVFLRHQQRIVVVEGCLTVLIRLVGAE
jgi:hypothetical protein